jgi:hypothetical protein
MLATVEVLKEYRDFLFGANVTIITDHKYLLAERSHNHRVFKWKQRKEKYNPNFVYIEGRKNIDAVVLSRLEMTEDEESSKEIMLNHPPGYPFDPIYNRYPLDLYLFADLQSGDLELQRVNVNNNQLKISKIINQNIITRRPKGS